MLFPLAWRVFDVGTYPYEGLDDGKAEGDQEPAALPSQIQALFSFSNSQISAVLGCSFGQDSISLLDEY